MLNRTMPSPPTAVPAPLRAERWVRGLAIGLTVVVFLLESYMWFGWKISQDLMRTFGQTIQEPDASRPVSTPVEP